MKETILILVKTYPTFSRKYFELVCTAGVNEKGQWRRIYPVPFRDLSCIEQYKKYQWIEADIEKNSSDPRPESFKLRQGTAIKILGDPVTASNGWHLRREALKNTPVYTRLADIIHKANVKNSLSLCQFKPREIFDLKIKKTETEWNQNILDQIRAENAQGFLFEDMSREIQLVEKLPYKFSYHFIDEHGKTSTLMIEDWEIGQLYRNCLERANGSEE